MTDPEDSAVAPEVPLREQILHAFARFGPAWFRFLNATVSGSDVSPSGVRLLSMLRRREESPIMRNLVNALGTTARAVTGLVDTLEREGLVQRAPHPSDRRATCILLTKRGEDIADRLWTDHLRSASAVFDALSPQDQATLVRILGVLIRELAARGLCSTPGCATTTPPGDPTEHRTAPRTGDT